MGVQPSNCSPIVSAFKRNSDEVTPVEVSETIAKSLAIGEPADGVYALKTIRESGGVAEEAIDEEVVNGIMLLAKTEGIFAEPAGGLVIAVLKKLVEEGKILPSETVVCYITGNGLKTLEAVEGMIQPIITEPDLSLINEIISQGVK